MLGQRAEAAAQALGLEYEMADAGHMVNDAAALLAGIVIAFTGWTPIDPLLSLGITSDLIALASRLRQQSKRGL